MLDKERIPFWNDCICGVFANLSSVPLSDVPFHGEVEHHQLDFMGMASVTSSPVKVYRDQSHIMQASAGYYKFSFQLAGEAVVEQDDRQTVLQVGDWACYDTTRPYALHFPNEYRQLVLQVPRRQLALSRAHMSQITAYKFSANEGLGNILGQTVSLSWQQLNAIPNGAHMALAQNITTLLNSYFQTYTEDGRSIGQAKATKLLEVQHFIVKHLADPQLSVNFIAQCMGLSVRYLHNLYKNEPETLSQFIRRLRLERCRQDLVTPHKKHLTITDIAFAWGFNSSTHFGRVFRQMYQVSPNTYRQQHLPDSI